MRNIATLSRNDREELFIRDRRKFCVIDVI